MFQQPQQVTIQPVYVEAQIQGYIPPKDYLVYYQFYLCRDSEEILQTYSLSNIIYFTSQQLGDAVLKCDCILVQRRIQDEYNPYIIQQPKIQITEQEKPFLSAELPLHFKQPGNQKPPCCISITNCSSPIYRVPVLNQLSAPLIRVFYTPDVPRQATNFTAPQYVPLPNQIDFNQIQSGLKNWHPPLRQISFTPWIQTQQNEETYVSTFGMIPNVIYQCKHQILDGQKKLELKQKVSYQAENVKSNFKVQPCFAAEAKNRQFLIIANNSIFSNSLENALKISENKEYDLQSSILNAYGDCIVNYDQTCDKNNEFVIESYHKTQRNKIIGCNEMYTYMILSDVCEYPCDFINNEATDNKSLILNQISSIKMNPNVQNVFAGQKLAICYHSNIPKQTITCATINKSLFNIWKKEFIQYQQQGGDTQMKYNNLQNCAYLEQVTQQESTKEETQQQPQTSCQLNAKELQKQQLIQCPKYRPLITITTFQVLENNYILAAGQAEVVMQEYPIIRNIVCAQLSTTKYKKLDVDKMSLLTAVIILLSPQGDVLNAFYAIDQLPMTMNCVELVQLQTSSNERQVSDLPGFITKNGYSIVHSVINQLDTTNKDVLAVLPRQEAILHLDYIKWTQDVQVDTDNVILYQSDLTESELAKKVQSLIGKDLVPIAVSRVSKRLLIMVNNKRAKQIELIIFLIPNYMQNGMKDVNDLLSETDTEQILDSPMSTDGRTEDLEQTEQLKILSRIVLQENKQATDASLLGQLKGGIVAAYKYGDKYELIELNRHNEVVFAENIYAKHVVISRII